MGRADRRRFIVFGRGVVASIERGKVTLYSRNGKFISDSYLPVARALEKLKRDVVIDGELVARDAHGISSSFCRTPCGPKPGYSTASST
jgi:hypothetical protein